MFVGQMVSIRFGCFSIDDGLFGTPSPRVVRVKLTCICVTFFSFVVSRVGAGSAVHRRILAPRSCAVSQVAETRDRRPIVPTEQIATTSAFWPPCNYPRNRNPRPSAGSDLVLAMVGLSEVALAVIAVVEYKWPPAHAKLVFQVP
jgi:hypothetical protein